MGPNARKLTLILTTRALANRPEVTEQASTKFPKRRLGNETYCTKKRILKCATFHRIDLAQKICICDVRGLLAAYIVMSSMQFLLVYISLHIVTLVSTLRVPKQ